MYLDFAVYSRNINNYFDSYDYKLLYNYAKNKLSQKRSQHCLSVGEMLYKLNPLLGKYTALILGIGHDLTKEMDVLDAEEVIFRNKIPLYIGEKENPSTFHAVTGYYYFRQIFPNAPLEFSFAIRHHTVLSSQYKSRLCYDLFVADKIEETRKNISSDFRKTVVDESNFEKRVLYLINMNNEYLKKKNKQLLNCTVELYNELKNKYYGKEVGN